MTTKINEIDWTDKNSNMMMNVGKKCCYYNCNILDILPFKCKYCKNIYCIDHRTQLSHKCSEYIDKNWKPLPTNTIKKLNYIKCQIKNCNNLIENKLVPLMLAKCNKCNKIRCSNCRIDKKCCE